MSERRRTDGGVIVAVVLIALGAWLLMGQVFGDWWNPVRQVFAFLGRLAFPLGLIAAGALILLAVRGNLGRVEHNGKRLYRSRDERVVAGVLGGLGEFAGINPTVLRFVYVVFAIFSGFFSAVFLYIIAAFFIPEEPVNAPVAPLWPQETGRETVQTPAPSAPPAPEPPAASAPSAPQPPSAPEPPV